MVTQNIDDAAAYFLLDETGVKKQFRIPQEEHFDSKTWLRKTLVMWLYKDHGLLNAWGHGNPRAAGYEKIPSDVTNITPLEKIQPETIRLAVKQFSGVTAYGDKTAIDFFIILRHIRRDTLFFRVKNISGEWKIVLHEWMIQ
ncbi:MAG: hypothetical protein HYT27_02385 [Parcubacteria group bacterium]|nr:hypothetical protein [Parcubacteria group bacterium]